MIRLISVNNNNLYIKFGYNPNIVADIRQINGRYYVAQDKLWTIPITSLSLSTIEKLKQLISKYEFKTTPEVVSILQIKERSNVKFTELAATNEPTATVIKESDLNLAEGIKLRGYQLSGIQYLVESKNCILGYAMRLGKSITAGAAIKYLKGFPLLIITTSSTKIHWKNEFEQKLLVPNTHIINGKTKYDLPINCNVYIINYAILADHVESLIKLPLKSVIVDEIHNFGSKSSARTKAAIQISKKVDIKYGLTGTLFRNNIKELATILEVIGIMPKISSSSWEFLHTYTNASHNGYGWTFDGGRNLLELNEKLVSSGSYLRKTQADVIKELPTIQTTILPTDISNRSEYSNLERGIKQLVTDVKDNQAIFDQLIESEILAGKRLGLAKKLHGEKKQELITQVLKKITLLKECVGRGKVDSAVEWIDAFLNETGEKLVVFAHHKSVQNAILNKFKNQACSIFSEHSSEKREEERTKFNSSSDRRVIVCSLMAASEGIDLSSANTVLHTEYWWNPAIMNQASARIQRVGKLDPLSIYYLSAENSIDQYSEQIIGSKAVLNDAVDGIIESKNFFNYFSLDS